jgi:hypothetical protein
MEGREPLVRVVFRKAVSDGNYGNEAAEVTLEEEVTSARRVEEMLVEARRLVHAELAKSPNYAVRHAVTPPPPPELIGTAPLQDREPTPFDDIELEDAPL